MKITHNMATYAMGAAHLVSKKKVSYQLLKEHLEETFRIKRVLSVGDWIHIKQKHGTFTVAEKSYFTMRLTTNSGRNFWVRYDDFNKRYVSNPSESRCCEKELKFYKGLVQQILCNIKRK